MSQENENSESVHITETVTKKFSENKLRIDEFENHVDGLQTVSSEVRKLWKEIYRYAIEDRTSAFVLFVDLSSKTMGNEQSHLLNGKLLTGYIERMNKANDQLTKLAELVEKASSNDEEIDAEALYSEL